ncbi:hypothetical protein CW713_04735 [Methanophagales archaeon]|nr:MAG: hypothetical protein CW713_04735 [Methanophagales archaeon]
MIVELLVLARRGRKWEKIEEVDLNDLLREIEEGRELFIKENNARIEFGHLPKISCHRAWMITLFTNLIMNGITYNDKYEKVVRIGFKDGGGDFFQDEGMRLNYEGGVFQR